MDIIAMLFSECLFVKLRELLTNKLCFQLINELKTLIKIGIQINICQFGWYENYVEF